MKKYYKRTYAKLRTEEKILLKSDELKTEVENYEKITCNIKTS